jgi:cold shock CspA family protein
VQATVRTFDLDTHHGEVLFDDGTSAPFDASAFARSGLLRLRVGQRVRLRLDADGRIEALTLATFPEPD